MDVYIYQADYLCDECGAKARKRLAADGLEPENPANEYSYDSDEFPKGPMSDGGGESDKPEHCHNCHRPLGNDLTDDGVKYVMEHVDQALLDGRTNIVVREWAELLADYSLTADQKRMLKQFQIAFPAPDLSKAKIWVRVGDGSDYSEYGDDLDAAISAIKEHNPGRPLRDFVRGGIKTENYSGNNYISIFWGDSKADLVAELSTEEEAQLIRELDV